ncbi:Gfo/Idh/MocA family protein [Halopenitus sp. H-Gu1]|uniref:Gfo/Idh/MocA family protein n=1 Tax=Halopenitus sp. H-Gu1 TaxID=3242697 RepID=UPI00359E45C9
MQIGVLGTAAIARNHVIPAVQKTDHTVRAVASRDADRASTFADALDIARAYGSYETLVADDELDAVYIPLPNSLHEEWAIRSAEAGHHVLCEKPLATDVDGARRIRDACESAGVVLMEGYMHRYHPRTKRALAVAEKFDEIREFAGVFQAPRSGEADDLVSLTPECAGGSLMHLGCYPITVARWMMGQPDRATGTAFDTRDCGVDTGFSGVLGYDDGGTATLTCGFDTDRFLHRYRIEATNGWLEAERAFNPRDDEAETVLEYALDGRKCVERFDPFDHYRLEIEHFADCIENGREPLTGATNGIQTLAVIDALFESEASGNTVSIASE